MTCHICTMQRTAMSFHPYASHSSESGQLHYMLTCNHSSAGGASPSTSAAGASRSTSRGGGEPDGDLWRSGNLDRDLERDLDLTRPLEGERLGLRPLSWLRLRLLLRAGDRDLDLDLEREREGLLLRLLSLDLDLLLLRRLLSPSLASISSGRFRPSLERHTFSSLPPNLVRSR